MPEHLLSIIFLISATFLIGWLFIRPNVSKVQYAVFNIILIVYHALLIIDTQYVALLPTNIDAHTFHILASERASNPFLDGHLVFGVDYQIYQSALTLVYYIFGSSKIVGGETSILAFVLAFMILIKIMNILKYDTTEKIVCMVAFSLLPSVMIFETTTVREPWQLLFLMLIIFYGLLARIELKFSHFMGAFFFAIILGFMHKALFVYDILLLALLLYWPLKASSDQSHGLNIINKSALIILAALVTVAGILLILAGQQGELYDSISVIKDMFSGNVLQYLHWTTSTALESNPRSAFGVVLNTDSWTTLLTSLPLVYLHYMFGPFPWQIDSIKDLVVFFESVFRALLIIGFIVNYYKSSNKSNLLLLFIVYLSLTLFWSIATTNYGQAIRHHVLSGWIIILIGTPGLIILFKLIFMRKITNNG